MRLLRKRKGFSLLETVIYLLIIAALAVSFNYINPKNSIEQRSLITKAIMLDDALSQWYQSHDLRYPDKLDILKVYGGLPKTTDIKSFIYAVSGDKNTYSLTVLLPDKTIYKSPGSKL